MATRTDSFKRKEGETPQTVLTRAEFLRALRRITGRCSVVWLPGTGDTTTTTGDETALAGKTFTYNHSIATYDTPVEHLGGGVAIRFNGTDEEFDTPDTADLTYVAGSEMSIVALVNPIDATSSCIASKFDETTASEAREWLFELDGSDKLHYQMWDESANASIGSASQDTITQNEWQLLTGTYDGAAASSGVLLYKNATLLADTDSDTGTFVASENGATVVSFGNHEGTGGTSVNFFDGRMAMILIVNKVMSVGDLKAVVRLCNEYFDLHMTG
tara:strand:+ start:439 stop:1260 length:822 start_codon:yes stop_codon:yes gene_type:complete